MSYSRTFNRSITVTGTVSYSYPASEHGGYGTASYSQTVPVTINVNVDTDPFDRSVVGAANHVDFLTGAVTALEAAQVETIRETSDQVADTIIGGFFNFINSEVTMQKAESYSDLQSRVALVMDYSKAIGETHERMNSDVGRLRAHYKKIFDGIDEDFVNRIHKLDHHIIKLGTGIRDGVVLEPYKTASAFGLSATQEEGRAKGLMTTAWLRKKASDIVKSLTDYVLRTLAYKQNISVNSQSVTIDDKQVEYVPVAYMVSNGLADGPVYDCRCYVPEVNGSRDIASGIETRLREGNINAPGRMDNEEYQNIQKAFLEKAEQEFGSSGSTNEYSGRVYNEMIKLWNQNMNNIIAGGVA